MLEDWTSWHHTLLGRRVMTDRIPYFVIVSGSRCEDRDAARRRVVADLAGL
jgi:hypothetical protein